MSRRARLAKAHRRHRASIQRESDALIAQLLAEGVVTYESPADVDYFYVLNLNDPAIQTAYGLPYRIPVAQQAEGVAP